jgi:hypothetical protein
MSLCALGVKMMRFTGWQDLVAEPPSLLHWGYLAGLALKASGDPLDGGKIPRLQWLTGKTARDVASLLVPEKMAELEQRQGLEKEPQQRLSAPDQESGAVRRSPLG